MEAIAGRAFAVAGRPIRLRAVGRGSEGYRRLWDRPDRIEIAGWRPDLSAELAQARMLVMPLPYATGTGGRIAAALRSGMPVVASGPAVAVLPAAVQDLVTVGRDAQELADHVARLATDDGEWQAECNRVATAAYPDQAAGLNRWWRGLEIREDDGSLSRKPDSRRGPRRRVRSS